MGQNASISQPYSNLQTIQKKLQVLSAEGLLPTVKVILGWLRANCSLLTASALDQCLLSCAINAY